MLPTHNWLSDSWFQRFFVGPSGRCESQWQWQSNKNTNKISIFNKNDEMVKFLGKEINYRWINGIEWVTKRMGLRTAVVKGSRKRHNSKNWLLISFQFDFKSHPVEFPFEWNRPIRVWYYFVIFAQTIHTPGSVWAHQKQSVTQSPPIIWPIFHRNRARIKEPNEKPQILI